MPLFCFTSKEGDTIEEFFPMGKAPEKFESSEFGNEFRFYTRDRAAEWKDGPKSGGAGWPIECYASGVHASQAQELRDHFEKSGCATEVTQDGDPVYRNHQHRKKALACRGLHDEASFGN